MNDKNLRPEDKRTIWILILGVFLPLLDTTIVNLAVGSLRVAFATSLSSIQWVATGYTLAAAMIIPLCAWAANR